MFSRKVIIQILDKSVLRSNKHLVLCMNCTTSVDIPDSHRWITANSIFSTANVERFKNVLSRTSKHKYTSQESVVKDPKLAAVLVPFCLINGEPSVIFTLRSNTLSSHHAEVRWDHFYPFQCVMTIVISVL